MKICTGCNKEKSLDDFQKRANLDQLSPEQEQYRSRCKDCRLIYKKEKQIKSQKESRWRSRGIILTFEAFLEMIDEQNNLCAICNQEERTRYLAVDHDHETGDIRGLLCYSCNGKLGWLEKFFPEIMEYLRAHTDKYAPI